MTFKRSAMVLGAVLAVSVGVAQAAQEGGYVGGGLGNTRAPDLQDDACAQLNGELNPGYACSVDDSKTAFKVFGGYQFNPYVAAEGTFVYFGKFEGSASGTLRGITPLIQVDERFRYEASGLSGDVVGSLPITENFSLLARAGVLFWGVTDIFDEHTSGVSYDYGAGVEVDFTRNVGLRGEYARYADVGDSNTGKSNLDVASLSLIYRF